MGFSLRTKKGIPLNLAIGIGANVAMFSTMNLALMVGFWRWILGLQSGKWERTVRS